MEAARRYGKILRATLCEIERGVFYATYLQDNSAPDIEDLPRYQIGKSAVDAKRRLEGSARELGYDTVSWKESITVPVFSPQTKTIHRKPVVDHTRYGGQQA